MSKDYCPIEDAIANTELVLHPDLNWYGSDPIALVIADAYDAGLDEADHPLDDDLGGYSELTISLSNQTIRAAADKIKKIHAKDLASKDQTIAALTERVRVLEEVANDAVPAGRELMMRLEQDLEDTIAGAGPGRVWIDSNSGMAMGKAFIKKHEAALAEKGVEDA